MLVMVSCVVNVMPPFILYVYGGVPPASDIIKLPSEPVQEGFILK